MPTSPPSLCTKGCGTLVYGGGQCPNCLAETRRERDQKRPNSTARGYDTTWQKTRCDYLNAHPQCECDDCYQLPIWNRPTATDVDHIDGLGPRGPRGHDWSNLQSLTHSHHSRKTVRTDGGFGQRRPNSDG